MDKEFELLTLQGKFSYILCSALRHKSYCTLPYLHDFSLLELSYTCSLENNAFSVLHYAIKLSLHYLMLHRSRFILPWTLRAQLYLGWHLASSQGCSLAISFWFCSLLAFPEFNCDWSIHFHIPEIFQVFMSYQNCGKNLKHFFLA